MATAWITGTGGLIGSHLAQLAPLLAPDWDIVPLNRQTLDLADFTSVARQFEQDSPSLLIHCAAISHSPTCEQQPQLAQQVNLEVTEFLAELFAHGRMIFFSTDLVFDGRSGNYIETDRVNPLGVYARTKVEAESAILSQDKNLVIRTSLNGGVSPTLNRGFNEVLEGAWRKGRTTRLFADEFRCPIAAPLTAQATWALVNAGATGIFHVAGGARLSRYQIGQLVAARHPELNPRIEEGSVRDFAGPPRPADCALNCAKARAVLPFPLPGLATWLEANPDAAF